MRATEWFATQSFHADAPVEIVHNNFYGSRMCWATDGILRDAKDGTTKVTCQKCIDAVERISADGP